METRYDSRSNEFDVYFDLEKTYDVLNSNIFINLDKAKSYKVMRKEVPFNHAWDSEKNTL